ncbi:unnamed protein product [Amoebophrya sp. A120]|nr:unnamed protein product [Amoebophrya sp. A120]|eukprot:GSA120T00024970001.1
MNHSCNIVRETEDETIRHFPIQVPTEPEPDRAGLGVISYVLTHVDVETLHRPFGLPQHPGSFANYEPPLRAFQFFECSAIVEIIRAEMSAAARQKKFAPRVGNPTNPRSKTEKHINFIFQSRYTSGSTYSLNSSLGAVFEPSTNSGNLWAQWHGWLVLLQEAPHGAGGLPRNIALGFCEVKEGTVSLHCFSLHKFGEHKRYFVRPLSNALFNKKYYAALTDLFDTTYGRRVAEQLTRGDGPARVLLSGTANDWGLESAVERLAASWQGVAPFNHQQLRALALERLSMNGVVLIQGPPGTGKSHLIVNGLVPEQVANRQKTLVVCNSNTAIDDLMLKVIRNNTIREDQLLRVGD